MKLYIDEPDLTLEELNARDVMINLFNPMLKTLLLSANMKAWVQYGFNSCRQTAIFGAVYLKNLLPDYTIIPYEGTFIDYNSDDEEPYEHCFIIASKDSRNILIDISRTTRPLLFNVITEFSYPNHKGYEDTVLLTKHQINLRDMYYANDICEFFTRRKPKEVMDIITRRIDEFRSQPKEAQEKYCEFIYTSFTKIWEVIF